jgi:hypothetical protein
MNGLSPTEEKSMRQIENITGIEKSINKELKKEKPNQTKLNNLNLTLAQTKNAFDRTQKMAMVWD